MTPKTELTNLNAGRPAAQSPVLSGQGNGSSAASATVAGRSSPSGKHKQASMLGYLSFNKEDSSDNLRQVGPAQPRQNITTESMPINLKTALVQQAAPATATDPLPTKPSVPAKPKAHHAQPTKEKAREFKEYLQSMKQELTGVITEQRSKLPLEDANDDAQHRQDWQLGVLPRAWVIQKAGYTQLSNKVQNHKRKRKRFIEPQPGSEGTGNWELLAEDLCWPKATMLCPRADAQVLKEELTDVIVQQRKQLAEDELEHSEWQLDCMPRYTALVNADYEKLAVRMDSYKRSKHGSGARERLANELGWTLAEPLYPKLTLQELEQELTTAISGQQGVKERFDPDWQHKHVPRDQALKAAGLSILASKLRRFQGDVAREDALSGRAGVAEMLGWRLAKPKRQPPAGAEQLALELTQVIDGQRSKLGADSPEWQPEHLPLTNTMVEADLSNLAYRVTNYNRYAQSADRGRAGLAQDLGWSLISSSIAPPGKWQTWEACVAEAKKVMSGDAKYRNTNRTPTKRWFNDKGHKTLTWAVVAKHFPAEHGGWAEFMRRCGRHARRNNNGSSQPRQIEARLHQFLAASGHPDVMPTVAELTDISGNEDHPLHDYAKGLGGAIGSSGFSAAYYAKRLGLKPRRSEFVTDKERQLLEEVLEQIPHGEWQSICKLYNSRRGDMPERTVASLQHLLHRAQHGTLLFLRCAKQLALVTSEVVTALQHALQNQGVLDDDSALQSLANHASACRRLAKVADVNIPELLKALRGQLGSAEWLQGIHEQLEIEGQVQFWQVAMQKQTKKELSMAEVWHQTAELQPFKSERLALSLDNPSLVAALQGLVQKALITDTRPSAAAAAHETQLQAAFFTRTVAFNLVQKLPDCECAKPRIQTVPLIQQQSQLQGQTDWHYDPAHLPLLPNLLEALYTTGRLAGTPVPQWSKFWPMNFESAQGLRRAAGASPGIYQIFLCRYGTGQSGNCKLLMRTEWYVGAASIAFAGRIPDYLPLSACGHPGPSGEATKQCLFWAACEHGFAFEMRFLKLDDMTPAEVYLAESHYLQYKWPLNKRLNCNVRTHPPLNLPSRLAVPSQQLMHLRIDSYPRDSLHKSGVAQLAATAATAAETQAELCAALEDSSSGCESSSEWDDELSDNMDDYSSEGSSDSE